MGKEKKYINFSNNYNKLTTNERKIIEELIKYRGSREVDDGYSGFCRILNVDTVNRSNIRKAFLNLEKRGIVCIEKGGNRNSMVLCRLSDNWMEKI